jgi:hypothetical protein
MKFLNLLLVLFCGLLIFGSCKKDDDVTDDPKVDPGTSSTELLVKKFTSAPSMDAVVDDMWGTCQKLVGTTEVPTLAARGTHLNGDGEGFEENLGLFFPYSGEKYDFSMRAGYYGENIYMLIEWDDDEDSRDRQSWYFDATDSKWKGEHKYANANNDKFYEDKFSFLFPIGDVTGFNSSTCYATCHSNLILANPKDKHTRHYASVDGEKIDMWHWKRVRGTYAGQVDDQKMVYADPSLQSAANGRKGDGTGSAGYSNNSQELEITGTADMVKVPKYVIPNATGYYWIDEDQIGNGTAKLVTAVDANGVLTYDGGTIDPATGGYEQGVGNKRFPSVTTKAFTLGRADISIKSIHTGTGWICEVTRKLNTGDEDDVVFDLAQELPFGFAIFNNAAIAHGVKPGLLMKFEE